MTLKSTIFTQRSYFSFIVNVLDPFDPVRYSILIIPMLTVFMASVCCMGMVSAFYTLMIFYTGVRFRMVCLRIDDVDQRLGELGEDEVLQELKSITIAHQEAIRQDFMSVIYDFAI